MHPFDTSWQQENLDGKIVVALERISESFRVMLWQKSKLLGISPIQLQILIFCENHPPNYCKVGYLAREFNMTKPTISDSVGTLTKKNLITKEPVPEDSRSYIINLTAKGQALVQQSLGFTDQILKAVEPLSPLEKSNTFSSLLGIIDRLNQVGIISIQRMCLNCQFYQRRLNGPFCSALEKPLKDKDLRIDCPEHQPKDI